MIPQIPLELPTIALPNWFFLTPVLPQNEVYRSTLPQNEVFGIVLPQNGVFILPQNEVFMSILPQNGVYQTVQPQNEMLKSVTANCQLSCNLKIIMDFVLDVQVKTFRFCAWTLPGGAEN
jgi:hypothetical protein